MRSHLQSRLRDHAGYYREPYPLTQTGEDGSEYEVYGDPASEREYERVRTKLDLSRVLSPLEQEESTRCSSKAISARKSAA